jgi:hypothetical protein
MAGKPKKLCKWSEKKIESKMSKLKKELRQPEYVCRKCARAAASKDWLCKPERLDE